jgi:hypothetical protein
MEANTTPVIADVTVIIAVCCSPLNRKPNAITTPRMAGISDDRLVRSPDPFVLPGRSPDPGESEDGAMEVSPLVNGFGQVHSGTIPGFPGSLNSVITPPSLNAEQRHYLSIFPIEFMVSSA